MNDVLPKGYSFLGEPKFHDTEDCMGRSQRYWTVMVGTPNNGNAFIGFGHTSAEAMNTAIKHATARAEFDALQNPDKLQVILDNAKYRGRFYDKELVEVISIIAERIK